MSAALPCVIAELQRAAVTRNPCKAVRRAARAAKSKGPVRAGKVLRLGSEWRFMLAQRIGIRREATERARLIQLARQAFPAARLTEPT